MKKIIPLLIAAAFSLCVFVSCYEHAKETKATPEEKIKISNNGVDINYTDSRKSDTVLLFVHGWAINQTYWSGQVDFFNKNYRVITLDLPGFGLSGKNRKNWSVEDYAKDISALISGLDLKNIILIGHSMSGAIVLETALENPSKVIGVVGIDNFKSFGSLPTAEEKKQTAEIYKMMRTDYKSVITEYTNKYLFSPYTDSTVRKRVLHDFTTTDSVIAVDCMEQGDQYSVDEKLRTYKGTLYLINSSFSVNDTASFRKNNIAVSLHDIGPTGHYPMIEEPVKFNEHLQMILDEIKGIKPNK